MVGHSESTLRLFAEKLIRSSHRQLLPARRFRRYKGFRLGSRLPIDNPSAWQISGVGRAFVLSRCAAGNRWHSTTIRIIQLLKGGVNDRITKTDAGGIAAPQLLA
jgi:hypothetical protein